MHAYVHVRKPYQVLEIRVISLIPISCAYVRMCVALQHSDIDSVCADVGNRAGAGGGAAARAPAAHTVRGSQARQRHDHGRWP